ncbi:MAG: 2-oxoacid:acceptor oxidoreductase family protein [Candidatus Korarchaeota archaeon]|nr:2-oxoacid:acceptor oxidoreductase family protein [Candidatus Korarchaeota archaeon]
MIEIRWHGRGGQGVWSGSAVLAYSAIKAGKYAQSFPQFGPERIGGPVTAFNRIDDKPIVDRGPIYEPDIVIVIDPSLLKPRYMTSLLSGLKKGGYFLANSEKSPSELREELDLPDEAHVWSVDATTIALEEIGRASPNTTMLGMLLAATNLLPVEYLEQGILWRWPGSVGEKNINALKRAMKEAKSDPAKEVVSV